MSLLFQSAVATAKGKIMLNLPTQHKLGVLQWLVIQQPVQFCSLYWGIAVFVLDGDAVDVQQGVPRRERSAFLFWGRDEPAPTAIGKLA